MSIGRPLIYLIQIDKYFTYFFVGLLANVLPTIKIEIVYINSCDITKIPMDASSFRYVVNGNMVTKYKVNLLKVKLLSESAIMPNKTDLGSAGYDLASPRDAEIEPRGRILLQLDIAIEIPWNCYGRIAPRSGLAIRHGLDVGAGVVDPSYRGNVGVVLFNHNDNPFVIHRGDRIAQLILEPYIDADAIKVNSLSETLRGDNGFGSSGISAPLDDTTKNIERKMTELSTWNEFADQCEH